MSGADVLPYDYEQYGKEIAATSMRAQEIGRDIRRPAAELYRGDPAPLTSSSRLGPRSATSRKIREWRCAAQSGLAPGGTRLADSGRTAQPSWFRHVIYAPGSTLATPQWLIPGVSEAIDKHDLERTRQQSRPGRRAEPRGKGSGGLSLMTSEIQSNKF